MSRFSKGDRVRLREAYGESIQGLVPGMTYVVTAVECARPRSVFGESLTYELWPEDVTAPVLGGIRVVNGHVLLTEAAK